MLFKKNRATENPYTQFRSMYSAAWHLGREQDRTLCDREDVIKVNGVISTQQVSDSLAGQHEGRFWCKKCLEAFDKDQ